MVSALDSGSGGPGSRPGRGTGSFYEENNFKPPLTKQYLNVF